MYYEYYHLDGTEEIPADYKEISFVCLRPDGCLELKVQLDESLTLNEKLNSENKTENIQALKNNLRKTKELLQSEKEKTNDAKIMTEECQDKLSGYNSRTFDRVPVFQPVSLLFSDGRVHSPVPVMPALAYLDIPLS